MRYLHSDVDTLRRVELLTELRAGVYDVLVGINLLREGLDLPEVSLVAILDADKEGFLRSSTSLIQTIGRAARNVSGQVHMYADVAHRLDEERHRRDQPAPREAGRVQHASTASTRTPLRKRIADITDVLAREGADTAAMLAGRDAKKKSPTPNLRHERHRRRRARPSSSPSSPTSTSRCSPAAGELKFELAARLRDELSDLKRDLRQMEKAGHLG